ncbi:MAG: hypothetical protein N2035_08315 [Chthoniobacterales bacterium]|nr:hypothetical protein [Chthoniobacterales bacterium]MCX7713648.1 hypothetical protein [Chthoniobacterales bacterium]
MSYGPGSTANVIAALASFFIPGLGQLIQGRLLPAVLFFIPCAIFYSLSFLILPLFLAVPLHIWCILNAALYRR